MAENRTYNDSPTFIPARLESSVHSSIPGNGNKGPVADAKDIYDMEHQKWQKDINGEVEHQSEHLSEVDEALNNRYTKDETYTKQEVNAKETSLQDQIDTLDGRVDDISGSIQFDEDGTLVTPDASSFEDNEQRGKIPTVGAVLDFSEHFMKGSTQMVLLTEDITLGVTADPGTQKFIVMVNNMEESITVTVPSATYRTPDGEDIVITIPSGGYGEVRLLGIGETTFAKV